MIYCWTHPTPRIRHGTGERIEQGDLFEPTRTERRRWPDRMAQADEICGAETTNGGYCEHPAGSCPVAEHHDESV
jgi:hypothetical protein